MLLVWSTSIIEFVLEFWRITLTKMTQIFIALTLIAAGIQALSWDVDRSSRQLIDPTDSPIINPTDAPTTQPTNPTNPTTSPIIDPTDPSIIDPTNPTRATSTTSPTSTSSSTPTSSSAPTTIPGTTQPRPLPPVVQPGSFIILNPGDRVTISIGRFGRQLQLQIGGQVSKFQFQANNCLLDVTCPCLGIPASWNCLGGYLKIQTGPLWDQQKFCGGNSPNNFMSTTLEMSITYKPNTKQRTPGIVCIVSCTKFGVVRVPLDPVGCPV